eukprot:scaffold7960_cov350-Prasinococcus_capsulatus_cf.AAC.3
MCSLARTGQTQMRRAWRRREGGRARRQLPLTMRNARMTGIQPFHATAQTYPLQPNMKQLLSARQAGGRSSSARGARTPESCRLSRAPRSSSRR